MNSITTIELLALVTALGGTVLLLSPRERRRQGRFGPYLLALLSMAAILHLLDFLEWQDHAFADRLGDMMRVVIPMLWLGLAFDAFRSARDEENLRRVEQFRLILEQTNLPTILVDDRGQIVDCSDSFLFRSACLREELIGRRVRDVGILPRAAIEAALKRAIDCDGTVCSARAETMFWAGEQVVVSWAAQRWLDPATRRAAGVSEVLEDDECPPSQEEERKASEESTIATAIPDLRAGDLQADAKRDTAHDLANFLQIITGQAELLAFDLDLQLRDRALSISQAGKTAFELVRALSGPHGKEISRQVNLDLIELVESTITLLQPTLPPNLRLVFEPNLGKAEVLGDRIRLQRVLVNLLINARDAMPKGGAIVIKLDVRDCEAQLLIIDEGHGVPDRLKDQIFNRYVTTKAPGDGNGIGLSVAKEVIDQHGGAIKLVESTPRGSRFLLTLPLSVEEHVAF